MTAIRVASKLIAQGEQITRHFCHGVPEAEGVRGSALAAGAVGFLGKPFSDQKLISCFDPSRWPALGLNAPVSRFVASPCQERVEMLFAHP